MQPTEEKRKLPHITNGNVGLVLLGIGLIVMTVSLLLVRLWHENRQTFLWVGGFFLAIAIVEIAFCRRQCPLPASAAGGDDIIEHHGDNWRIVIVIVHKFAETTEYL